MSHPYSEEDYLNRTINISKKTSPGLDGIRNGHLENLDTENRLTLLKDNEDLNKCCIPSDWFNFQTTALKKRNCCLIGKLFGRILCSCLEWHLESQNIFSNCQSEFRRPRSARDTIIALWSTFNLAIAKSLVTCFLNISTAFNSVSVSTLKSNLKDFM